jgi:hypothetical protein
MVEKVVSALSSFRQAARNANDNVSQILSDLKPTVSRGGEVVRELRDSTRANTKNDEETRAATAKTAVAAGENASLSEQILNELKNFSERFTTLLSGDGEGGGGSLFGSLLGLGAAATIAAPSILGGDPEDLEIEETPEGGWGYETPVEGFEDLDIGDVDFAPGAIISPISEGAHKEARKFATKENINTTVSMFSQMQGQFGGSLTVNDFIPKTSTTRTAPSKGGGSQHWYGKAMDISTRGMGDKDKLRLIEAALKSGFRGFGFGNTILHVDWGANRSWAYGNAYFGGVKVEKLQNWVEGGGKPEEVVEALEASPLADSPETPMGDPGIIEDEAGAAEIPLATVVEEPADKTLKEKDKITPTETPKVAEAAGLLSEPIKEGISPAYFAVSESKATPVEFEPSSIVLASASPDISIPSLRGVRASGARSGVENTEPSTYSPPVSDPPPTIDNNRNREPLLVNFDMAWIKEANDEKDQSAKSWVA